VLALESLTGFLKGTIAPDSDYYTHEIAWSFENVADQRSFALRLVIHYVGDLHQPLHAVSEVDYTYTRVTQVAMTIKSPLSRELPICTKFGTQSSTTTSAMLICR